MRNTLAIFFLLASIAGAQTLESWTVDTDKAVPRPLVIRRGETRDLRVTFKNYSQTAAIPTNADVQLWYRSADMSNGLYYVITGTVHSATSGVARVLWTAANCGAATNYTWDLVVLSNTTPYNLRAFGTIQLQAGVYSQATTATNPATYLALDWAHIINVNTSSAPFMTLDGVVTNGGATINGEPITNGASFTITGGSGGGISNVVFAGSVNSKTGAVVNFTSTVSVVAEDIGAMATAVTNGMPSGTNLTGSVISNGFVASIGTALTDAGTNAVRAAQSTPTLQSVTDAGNATSNAMLFLNPGGCGAYITNGSCTDPSTGFSRDYVGLFGGIGDASTGVRIGQWDPNSVPDGYPGPGAWQEMLAGNTRYVPGYGGRFFWYTAQNELLSGTDDNYEMSYGWSGLWVSNGVAVLNFLTLNGTNVLLEGGDGASLTGITAAQVGAVSNNAAGIAAAGGVTGGVFSVGTSVSNVAGVLYIPTNRFTTAEQLTAATNTLGISLTNQLNIATNTLGNSLTNAIRSATNSMWQTTTNLINVATNTLGVGFTNNLNIATNALGNSLTNTIRAATNTLGISLTNQLNIATNTLWVQTTNVSYYSAAPLAYKVTLNNTSAMTWTNTYSPWSNCASVEALSTGVITHLYIWPTNASCSMEFIYTATGTPVNVFPPGAIWVTGGVFSSTAGTIGRSNLVVVKHTPYLYLMFALTNGQTSSWGTP